MILLLDRANNNIFDLKGRTHNLNHFKTKPVLCRLCIATAAVRSGIKPSALYSLYARDYECWLCEKEYILDYLGLKAVCVYSDCKRITLFLYDENALSEHFEGEEVSDFLHEYGFTPENGVSAVISQLLQRYSLQEFPHEIGVLLGYPVADVRGCIEHNGQNYLLSRYWKVYENPVQAASIFERIDVARKEAHENFIAENVSFGFSPEREQIYV